MAGKHTIPQGSATEAPQPARKPWTTPDLVELDLRDTEGGVSPDTLESSGAVDTYIFT